MDREAKYDKILEQAYQESLRRGWIVGIKYFRMHHNLSHSVSKKLREILVKKHGNSLPNPTVQTQYAVKQTSSDLEISAPKSRIKTLEELIKVCEIDTSVWECYEFTANKWDGIPPTGTIEDFFQIKARFKRKSGLSEESAKAAIVDFIKEHSTHNKNFVHKGQTHDACLMIPSFYDIHFDKLVWEEESGHNYDSKIAQRIIDWASSSIIEKSSGYKIDRILLPLGNDFFNTDTIGNTTTSGTPQDVDSKWQKSFRKGLACLITMIDRFNSIAPVDVVIVPGNHDRQKSFYLGEAISAWYNKSKSVRVHNNPGKRTYYQWGTMLFGFTHGDRIKLQDLPIIMATEVPQYWAQSEFREWHIGHFHHKKEIKFFPLTEEKGVRIRMMPSLTGTDAWHHNSGYVGAIRAAESYIYSPENGFEAQFSTNITEKVQKELLK